MDCGRRCKRKRDLERHRKKACKGVKSVDTTSLNSTEYRRRVPGQGVFKLEPQRPSKPSQDFMVAYSIGGPDLPPTQTDFDLEGAVARPNSEVPKVLSDFVDQFPSSPDSIRKPPHGEIPINQGISTGVSIINAPLHASQYLPFGSWSHPWALPHSGWKPPYGEIHTNQGIATVTKSDAPLDPNQCPLFGSWLYPSTLSPSGSYPSHGEINQGMAAEETSTDIFLHTNQYPPGSIPLMAWNFGLEPVVPDTQWGALFPGSGFPGITPG